MHGRFLATALAASMVATASGAAQDAGAPESGRPLSPPPVADGTPLTVDIGFYLIEVRNLDQILQTFEVEGYIKLLWNDPRLAFDPDAFGASTKDYRNDLAAEQLGETVWWPSVEMVTASEGGALSRHWLTIESTGEVGFEARINAVVTSEMNLRQFPFDRQVLEIPIEPYFYGVESVGFAIDTSFTDIAPEALQAIPEWETDALESGVTENDYGKPDKSLGTYSRATFTIEIERQSAFYVYKIFLPLLLIVASSWTVFWIRDLGTNVGITFTIMLTVVAFNLAIADTLPKVPYLTFMDTVMVSSYVSVFLALLLVMIVYHFQESGQETAERRINGVARWAFPGGLLTALVLLGVIFLVG